MATAASQASVSGQYPASPARAAVEIIAITTHDDFLLELGQALGGQAAVHPVDSTGAALAAVGSTKSLQLLFLDTRDSTDLEGDIELLHSQAAQVPLLVFAAADTDRDIASQLKDSKVFAVLPLPVDASKTAAMLDSAVTQARTLAATPPSAQPAPEIREAPQPTGEDGGKGMVNIKVLAILGVLIAVLAAGAAWYFTHSGPKAAASAKLSPDAPSAEAQGLAPTSPPAIETSIVTGKVDDLLEKARNAMRERRYTEPAGDNALLYYRSAAAADPGSAEAQDGLHRVATVLATRAEDALSGSRLDEAATTLAQLKSAVAQDSRLPPLEARFIAARKELLRQQEETKRKQHEAEEAAAREAAVSERRAREARAAQLEADRQAQLAREKAEADARQKAVEDAAKAARATPTKAASAGQTAAQLQSSLKRKRYTAPEYPQDALARRIGGVVTLEFTVNVKGEPRDIHVVKAEPANTFDRATIDAVRRWRYEPPMVDGVPTEVPVRMAIRFAPPE